MWTWADRGLDQLAILARDIERSNAMPQKGDDLKPAPPNPYANFNSWQGKSAAQWWAEARAATDVTTRDEAISVARSLQESDDLTQRFEGLTIVRRYRAAVAREAQS